MAILGHENNPTNQGGRIPGPERGLGNPPGPIGLREGAKDMGLWEPVVDKYAALDDKMQREEAARVKGVVPGITEATNG